MTINSERIETSWVLPRGVTYDYTWTWTRSDVAVNTTGGTGEAVFRNVLDGTALLTANAGNSKLTHDDAGVFTWALTPADIALLGDKGIWDFKFTESGGAVRSPIGGKYVVNDDN